MNQDPDIRLEAAVTAVTGTATHHQTIPLNAFAGAHRATKQTTALAQNAGGLEKFREMTNAFYRKAFVDPQLDPFIRSHDDPHGERFACWIAEKMGLGQPWTQERRTRKSCPFHSHGHSIDSAHDRSSAHFAAWHSPKRPREKFGTHFKLDDCLDAVAFLGGERSGFVRYCFWRILREIHRTFRVGVRTNGTDVC
jgi:truncated hemoglobin YjbI